MSDLATGSLWLDQAVGHHVEGNLTADEAATLTAKIKSYVGVTWVLIAEAHERRAHKALGYKTWAEYVEAEFDISRSRSYQLISQARVVLEISESVSTMVDISEREARDLAPHIDEVKAAASDAVSSLPVDATEEERTAAVRSAVDGVRAAKQTHVTTTTETTTTTFDPETAEILDGARGSSDSPPPGQDESPSAADVHDEGEGADGDVGPHGSASRASSASVPPVDPTLGYRARATGERSKVRSGLLTLDPERVIETSDDHKAWADLSADLRSWLDRLDTAAAGPHLRAVR